MSKTQKNKSKQQPDFESLARNYITEREKALVFHGGKLYRYDGCRYREETELAPKVRRFLIEKNIHQNNFIVSNIKSTIEAIAFKSTDVFPELPFFAGLDPFPPHIIPYRNGLLDIEGYLAGKTELLPHTHHWVSMVCLPYGFNQKADCPQWLAFLNEVFDGDEKRIRLLQEWFGYCLTSDASHHKILVKIGPPRAGKGTTDRVLGAILGEENTTGYCLHSLADRFGLGRLVAKLVAFVGEVNLGASRDKYRILETLNSIVGGDKVSIEEKHNPQCLSTSLPIKFNISCNEMPSFVDPTGALSARLLILNFDNSFLGREDRQLEKKLLSEISGINNWALEGLRLLKQQGRFTETEKGKELSTEFRRTNSDAFAFLQDCLVVQKSINPGGLENVRIVEEEICLPGVELQQLYADWAADNNAVTEPRWLSRNLSTILPKLKVERPRIDGKRVRVYHGIGEA